MNLYDISLVQKFGDGMYTRKLQENMNLENSKILFSNFLTENNITTWIMSDSPLYVMNFNLPNNGQMPPVYIAVTNETDYVIKDEPILFSQNGLLKNFEMLMYSVNNIFVDANTNTLNGLMTYDHTRLVAHGVYKASEGKKFYIFNDGLDKTYIKI